MLDNSNNFCPPRDHAYYPRDVHHFNEHEYPPRSQQLWEQSSSRRELGDVASVIVTRMECFVCFFEWESHGNFNLMINRICDLDEGTHWYLKIERIIRWTALLRQISGWSENLNILMKTVSIMNNNYDNNNDDDYENNNDTNWTRWIPQEIVTLNAVLDFDAFIYELREVQRE